MLLKNPMTNHPMSVGARWRLRAEHRRAETPRRVRSLRENVTDLLLFVHS